MIINEDELKRILEELKKNPEKEEILLKDFKLFHAIFASDDGIPPRFGKNFREEGPKWEKVTGADFESIGRILVCHLTIEHYINYLIELSSPIEFSWDDSRLTFSQKLKLVSNLNILRTNQFDKGIEIVNNIRNKLSHNLLAKIDEKKVDQLKKILITYLIKGETKEKKQKTIEHIDLFGHHAIIERFTSIVCAMIAGYCTRLIKKDDDSENYYSHIRSTEE
jgi:hypothetical protein